MKTFDEALDVFTTGANNNPDKFEIDLSTMLDEILSNEMAMGRIENVVRRLAADGVEKTNIVLGALVAIFHTGIRVGIEMERD